MEFNTDREWPKRRPVRRELRPFRTYGGWSVQRPEFGTLGRYSPDMTRLLPDGSVEMRWRLDRAAYQLHREAGVSHEAALHNALLCPSWASRHEAPALGSWEIEILPPDTDRVEMVAMLWPEDDAVWPLGEINVMEGRVGIGETMINLHWPDADTREPAHDPAMIRIDTTKRHRYGCRVGRNSVTWTIDGKKVRTLKTAFSPHATRCHLVVQGGVHRDFLTDWHENIEWEQRMVIRPLRAPKGA